MATTYYLAAHVYWARYAAGSSDQTNKPAAGSFTYLGQATDISFSSDVDLREVMKPMPGIMVRDDVKLVSQKIDATMTLSELGAADLEVFFKTGQLTAGSAVQFNPGEGAPCKGWAKFQLYDESNVLQAVVDLFGLFVPNGNLKLHDLATVDVKFLGCHSLLNTGSVTTLTA